jgi:hypothetical protein
LSGQVQLPVPHASSVGMLCGRAISSLILTMSSRSGLRNLSGDWRCTLVLGSHVL